MARAFVCRDSNTTYKVYDENFTILYSGTLTGGIYFFAADQKNECFFVTEDSILKKRSLLDGTLIATEFESAGAQKPFIVDDSGYLWTIDNTASNTIRKWENDLSGRTDYTIGSGIIDDLIYDMAMTYDGNYIYISGGNVGDEYRVKVAKLSTNNLTGNAEWQKTLLYGVRYFRVYFSTVDESNDLYVTGFYWDGTCVSKISGDDGSHVWGADDSPIYVSSSGLYLPISYSQETQSIYTPYKDPTPSYYGYFKQLDASDGSVIGTTQACGEGSFSSITRCCFVYDSELLFCGTTPNATLHYIYTFNISDNWGDSESSNTSQLLIKKPIWSAGDPTGYAHACFISPPDADFSGTPTSGYAPLTVSFTDLSTNNPVSWAWDFGDDNTDTDQNPSNIYQSAGTYDVSLTATNVLNSDTETKEDYITVLAGDTPEPEVEDSIDNYRSRSPRLYLDEMIDRVDMALKVKPQKFKELKNPLKDKLDKNPYKVLERK